MYCVCTLYVCKNNRGVMCYYCKMKAACNFCPGWFCQGETILWHFMYRSMKLGSITEILGNGATSDLTFCDLLLTIFLKDSIDNFY